MIAQDVCSDLEQAGAVVVGPAPSVNKALPLLEGNTLDAAVLDVNLGTERSFPVAAALEEQGVPFLFATGYNSSDIPPEWQHATVIMKPLPITALEQLLAAHQPDGGLR